MLLVVLVLVLLSGGAAGAQPDGTTTTTSSDEPPVLVVAHRGASAAAPEHTGPAYDRAVWAGADVLECDLQVTADDQLVCIHDTTVDRTTGGANSGEVGSYTLAELQGMDFGTWFGPEFPGARVVTLEEQITCYRAADPTMQFYVETKTAADADDQMETLLVEKLSDLDLVPEGDPDVRTSPVIVQSFDRGSLEVVRDLAPSLPTALLLNAPSPALDAGSGDLDVIAPSAAVLESTPDLISAAHGAGVEVHTWTVDDPAQMTTLIDAGIDGFFTNDPDLARGVVDEAGRGSGREPLDVDDAEPSSIEGCPDGLGVGLTAATDEIPTATQPPGTDGSPDDAAAPDPGSDSDGFPIVPVAVGAIVVAIVVATVVVVRGRKEETPPA